MCGAACTCTAAAVVDEDNGDTKEVPNGRIRSMAPITTSMATKEATLRKRVEDIPPIVVLVDVLILLAAISRRDG
jgi:hypothetical protein